MPTLRKIDRMHALFGRCEGHTCGECSNFIIRGDENEIQKPGWAGV